VLVPGRAVPSRNVSAFDEVIGGCPPGTKGANRILGGGRQQGGKCAGGDRTADRSPRGIGFWRQWVLLRNNQYRRNPPKPGRRSYPARAPAFV